MVEIALKVPRYTHLVKSQPNWAVKSKSIGVYKGRICARGDTALPTHMEFVANPTANRCGAILVLAISPQAGCEIRAVDISHASAQSGNSSLLLRHWRGFRGMDRYDRLIQIGNRFRDRAGASYTFVLYTVAGIPQCDGSRICPNRSHREGDASWKPMYAYSPD